LLRGFAQFFFPLISSESVKTESSSSSGSSIARNESSRKRLNPDFTVPASQRPNKRLRAGQSPSRKRKKPVRRFIDDRLPSIVTKPLANAPDFRRKIVSPSKKSSSILKSANKPKDRSSREHKEMAKPLDGWAPCDVCGAYNSVSGDLMVYCDGCEVAVHQWCYGILEIPEDSWFCDACEMSRGTVVSYQLLLVLLASFVWLVIVWVCVLMVVLAR
jgi:hypothetical protein